MTAVQQFVLYLSIAWLTALSIAGVHRRTLEYRLKQQFMKDQKDYLQGKVDAKVDEFFKFGRKED